MLITLPIAELVPGMFVDSVSKQQEHVNSIKIKTRGLVRDKTIIQRLISEGLKSYSSTLHKAMLHSKNTNQSLNQLNLRLNKNLQLTKHRKRRSRFNKSF